MATDRDRQIEHLLRRAGFGARPDEIDTYRPLSIDGAVDRLINYEEIPDDVDSKILKAGYALVTARPGTTFSPDSNILDARQRWLFRMIHSDRPLQEKMTLFWHNHFATGYTKLSGILNATRYLAAKPENDPDGVRGQIEKLRDNALGNFRDILVEIAKDIAMIYWLDGQTNSRFKPQENFGREIMELFTMGVGHYTEEDVYAAARVFTGWSASFSDATSNLGRPARFSFNAGLHEPSAKTFSFPIYANGSRTIPVRPATDGMQDGIDLINALAASADTARYLAGKLYRFFVSDFGDVSASFVNRIAATYLSSRYDMKTVMREVLLSSEFRDPRNQFTRYAWPVEFVVRAVKDIGWKGFSVNDALTPLANMGMSLYDPPDVAGWDSGKSWFSTGAMLARMNFGATIAVNQRVNLTAAVAPHAESPYAVLAFVLESMRTPPLDLQVVKELARYLFSSGAWTGSPTQLQQKVPGLVHLVVSTAEYQFV